jgi:orotidine-5'-phosphate decarboxylase
VGIDPHPELLDAWGLPPDANGLARFVDICVAAFGSCAAVVKPQSAFFEVYGSAGIAVLERAVAALRAAGALVLADVKRGDIGSTMSAYARAYLDPEAPLAVDAITVSPYLGIGSLRPAFDACTEYGTGLFALALTSNPEGPQVQHACGEDGRPVAQMVIDDLAARNAGSVPLGPFGAVVGETIGESVARLDAVNGPFLVPGVGPQGATPDDVRRIFGSALGAVVPTVSRAVLTHGPNVTALRDAVGRLVDGFTFLRP